MECAYDERDGNPYIFEINARIPGTQALSLFQGINVVHDACLVARGEEPPERLHYRHGVRAMRDPLMLGKTGRAAILLAALDPTRVGSIPHLSDPMPLVDVVLASWGRRWRTRASVPMWGLHRRRGLRGKHTA